MRVFVGLCVGALIFLVQALLCEDVRGAYGADGRVRRDAFKGYSQAQLALFYKENEALAVEKREAGALAKQDAAWAAHSKQLAALIEASEAEKAMDLRLAAAEHRAALESQAAEQKDRAAAAKASRFGSVGAGYFDGFGTSVR